MLSGSWSWYRTNIYTRLMRSRKKYLDRVREQLEAKKIQIKIGSVGTAVSDHAKTKEHPRSKIINSVKDERI